MVSTYAYSSNPNQYGSVGKGFNGKPPDKFLLKTATYFYIPPESSKEIEVILNAKRMDVPFSFIHKTLLLYSLFLYR